MAVSIDSAAPKSLLESILERFDQQTIAGWVKDGDCLRLTDPKWSSKGYLRPSYETGKLVFGLVPTEDHGMSRELYAVHLGRFIEMLLAYFSDPIRSVQVTTGMTYPDLMQWSGYRRSDSGDE